MTIDEAYDLYRQALPALGYAPGTRGNYLWNLHPFLAWLRAKGVSELTQVRKATIEAYQRSIARGRLSKATQGLRVRALKRWFEWLVKQGHLFQSPAEKIVESPKGWRRPPRIPSRDEIDRLLRAPDTSTRIGVRDRALLELLCSTGIRRAECEALDLKHVDIDAGAVRIEGRRRRVVPFGAEAKGWLKQYAERVRPRYGKKNPTDRAFFLDRQGRRLTGSKIYHAIQRAGRRAGLEKGIGVRALRHGFAARCLSRGEDVETVRKLLGHLERGTTSEAYRELLAEDKP